MDLEGGRERGRWRRSAKRAGLPLSLIFRLGVERVADELERLLVCGRVFGCACPDGLSCDGRLRGYPLALEPRPLACVCSRRARRVDLWRLARHHRHHRPVGTGRGPAAAAGRHGLGRAAAAAAATAADRRPAGCALRRWASGDGPLAGCDCAGWRLGRCRALRRLVGPRVVDPFCLPGVARPQGATPRRTT